MLLMITSFIIIYYIYGNINNILFSSFFCFVDVGMNEEELVANCGVTQAVFDYLWDNYCGHPPIGKKDHLFQMLKYMKFYCRARQLPYLVGSRTPYSRLKNRIEKRIIYLGPLLIKELDALWEGRLYT